MQTDNSLVPMRREVSGIIGIIGGLADVLTGASILYQNSMLMGAMMNSSAMPLGYSIIGLGVIVLLTGVSLFTSKAMNHLIGFLMLAYGLTMLVLGAGMMFGLLNVMMQWSSFSGSVMIALGVVMLYSGSNMTRKMM